MASRFFLPHPLRQLSWMRLKTEPSLPFETAIWHEMLDFRRKNYRFSPNISSVSAAISRYTLGSFPRRQRVILPHDVSFAAAERCVVKCLCRHFFAIHNPLRNAFYVANASTDIFTIYSSIQCWKMQDGKRKFTVFVNICHSEKADFGLFYQRGMDTSQQIR